MANRYKWLSLAAVLVLALTAFGVGTHGSYAQGNSRTFPETGKTVQGSFLTYWDTHGGLAQQGYPISDQIQQVSATDGKTYTVQYFERAVFEEHPEFAGTPNEVLLSLLGVFRYQQKYPNGAPGQSPNNEINSQLFSQTGHRVGGKFLDYWNSHGGLAQQGYPISDEFIEISDLDGKPYKVQYFERAVFEEHPEFAGTPNEVLLSQLGTFAWQAKQNPAQPTSVPAPVQPTTPPAPVQPTAVPTQAAANPCADIPASVNQTVTPNCGPAGTTFSFTGTGFQPGELVGIYATEPNQAVFGAPFQERADSNGTVSGVTLTLHSGDPLGVWANSEEGTVSHKKSIGYFKLISNTPSGGGGGGGGACDTSGSTNGTATPSSAGPGTTINFVATGFQPGEAVSYWFTLPSGIVLGTAAPVPGGVGSDGTTGFPLPIDAATVNLGEGRWALTFEGASTHHQAVIYFCLHK